MKHVRQLSCGFALLMIASVVAMAVAPTVTVNSAINLGSDYGWVSGTVNQTCDLTWTNSAGGSGTVGQVSSGFGFYVYPLSAGTNRITLQCDNSSAESGFARADISN